MSDAPTDVDAQMLARLAALDMAAVEHAHAQFVAATEPEAVNSLGRTYQRMARSLRQTLALKGKMAREGAADAARAKILDRRDEAIREQKIEHRVTELQDATDRIAGAVIADPEERDALLGRLDVEVDDWIEEDDFLTADFDHLLRRACRLMDLPENLVASWRTLPPIDRGEGEDATETDAEAGGIAPAGEAAPLPAPWRDSG